MDLDRLRAVCASLPGATRDIKWGSDEVYSVGTKMFAVFAIVGGRAATVAFKADPARFLELTDIPGVLPAPYLARAHWVQLRPEVALSAGDVRALVARSHQLVVARLPRKFRDGLGAPANASVLRRP